MTKRKNSEIIGQESRGNEKKQKLDIHEIILSGGIEELKTAVENKADIYAVDEKGNNILHILASIGWNSGLKYLISEGYDLGKHARKYNKLKILPIETAIDLGNESFVKLLIDNKYSLSKMPKGQDYVLRAIEKGRESIAITIVDEYVMTKISKYKIIGFAKQNEMKNLVNFINLKKNCLSFMERLENTNCGKQIESAILKAKEITENTEHSSIKSILHINKIFNQIKSEKITDTKIIDLFLENGVTKTNLLWMKMQSAMILYVLDKLIDEDQIIPDNTIFDAIDCDKPEIIEKIYNLKKSHSQPLNLEIKDSYCNTPLLTAAKKGNIKIIKLLISIGAKTDAIDNQGNTLLHLYKRLTSTEYSKEDIEFISDFISQGLADVNEVNKKGIPPIFKYDATKTICHNLSEISKVRILLNEGANLNIDDELSGSYEAMQKLIVQTKIIDNFFTRANHEITIKTILENFKTEDDFEFFNKRLKNLYHIKNSNLKIEDGAPNFEEYLQMFINEKLNPLPEKLLNIINNIYERYAASKNNLEGIIVREYYNDTLKNDSTKTIEEKERLKMTAPVSYKQIKELLADRIIDDKSQAIADFLSINQQLQDLNQFFESANTQKEIHNIVPHLKNNDDFENMRDYFKNFCSINGSDDTLSNLGETVNHFYCPESFNQDY